MVWWLYININIYWKKSEKVVSTEDMNNRSQLIRELLSGLTEKKLEQLFNLRKSIKKPIPTPRNNLDQSINQEHQ